MTTAKKMIKVIAAAACSLALVSISTPAQAGIGGSLSKIDSAIKSGGSDAIISELERAERLVCAGCIEPVMALLADDRYEVREVAAWWFSRRPAQKEELTNLSIANLSSSDSLEVRNAADILGTFRHPVALPYLSTAITRTDITAEARVHITRALGTIGTTAANESLSIAMGDADSGVRWEALESWSKIRWQTGAAPVAYLINDPDNIVRRHAAAVAGHFREGSARVALEGQLNDTDPAVRRNAAWALGRIGDSASRAALLDALNDESGLVRRVVANSLSQLN
jgi:HEAT repeat protein